MRKDEKEFDPLLKVDSPNPSKKKMSKGMKIGLTLGITAAVVIGFLGAGAVLGGVLGPAAMPIAVAAAGAIVAAVIGGAIAYRQGVGKKVRSPKNSASRNQDLSIRPIYPVKSASLPVSTVEEQINKVVTDIVAAQIKSKLGRDGKLKDDSLRKPGLQNSDNKGKLLRTHKLDMQAVAQQIKQQLKDELGKQNLDDKGNMEKAIKKVIAQTSPEIAGSKYFKDSKEYRAFTEELETPSLPILKGRSKSWQASIEATGSRGNSKDMSR
jgi:hypothetical protein